MLISYGHFRHSRCSHVPSFYPGQEACIIGSPGARHKVLEAEPNQTVVAHYCPFNTFLIPHVRYIFCGRKPSITSLVGQVPPADCNYKVSSLPTCYIFSLLLSFFYTQTTTLISPSQPPHNYLIFLLLFPSLFSL